MLRLVANHPAHGGAHLSYLQHQTIAELTTFSTGRGNRPLHPQPVPVSSMDGASSAGGAAAVGGPSASTAALLDDDIEEED